MTNKAKMGPGPCDHCGERPGRIHAGPLSYCTECFALKSHLSPVYRKLERAAREFESTLTEGLNIRRKDRDGVRVDMNRVWVIQQFRSDLLPAIQGALRELSS